MWMNCLSTEPDIAATLSFERKGYSSNTERDDEVQVVKAGIQDEVGD